MIDNKTLEQSAVDKKELSTNIIDIAQGCGCSLDGASLASDITNQFPLVTRLLQTPASARMRQAFDTNHVEYLDTNKWELKLPTTLWTNPPKNTGEDCCFESFDFNKCCGSVPMNIVCLKSCDTAMDRLVKRDLRFGKNVEGLASSGESAKAIERRIDKASLAWYTGNMAILGQDDVYTDTLKPFHGLLQVMNSPAVMKFYCYDILSVFEDVGCRLSFLSGNYFIAVNPITYRTIANAVRRGQDGELPRGWTAEPLSYNGIPFVQDSHLLVDFTARTGEAWVIDANTTGLFLATDLFIADSFIDESGVDTTNDSCGAKCTYYYNYGAAFNTDARKLAAIVDIPIDSACFNAMGDLQGLINPNTLIPNGRIDSTVSA